MDMDSSGEQGEGEMKKNGMLTLYNIAQSIYASPITLGFGKLNHSQPQ